MIGTIIGGTINKAKTAIASYNIAKKGLEYVTDKITINGQKIQSKKTTDDPELGSSNTSDQNIIPMVENEMYSKDNVTIIDADWVSSRFMVPDEDLEESDRINRHFSTVRWKQCNTMLGGHMAINPRPQYTRYADIRKPFMFGATLASETRYGVETKAGNTLKQFGLGRFYSESIDDNATTVFLTFGKPKFNSLFSFFTRSVNYADVFVATTGRMPGMLYDAGFWIGTGVMLIAFPLLTTLVWSFRLGMKFLGIGANAYDFYYMEESMKEYWYCVNNLCTRLAVEMGLRGASFQEDDDEAEKIGNSYKIEKEDIYKLKEYMGEKIIDDDTGWIDIFAVVARYQKLFNLYKQMNFEGFDTTSKDAFLGYVKRTNTMLNGNNRKFADYVNHYLTFANWKKGINQSQFYNEPAQIDNLMVEITDHEKNNDGSAGKQIGTSRIEKADVASTNVNKTNAKAASILSNKDLKEEDLRFIQDPVTERYSSDKFMVTLGGKDDETVRPTNLDYFDKYGENGAAYLNSKQDGTVAEVKGEPGTMEKYFGVIDSWLRDGGRFAIFNVDYQGPASESVSSSVSDMAIKDGMKSVARGVRDINFNLAGGNILGEIQKKAVDGLKEFFIGAADGITLGLSNIVAGLLGGAYVDIPKKWDDSEMSFPQFNYKMKLISPYGNPISQFMDIYIPLCMLMAGAFPLSSGSRSYTSPFLCSLFNKGVQNIRMGMITQLSIERGTSNLAFGKTKRALAVDVSFTVTDFSTLPTSPLSAKGVFGNMLNFDLDDDAPLQKYLNTMASRDIWTEIYMVPKIKNLFATKAMNLSQFVSPNYWGTIVGSAFYPLISPFTARMGVNTSQLNTLH